MDHQPLDQLVRLLAQGGSRRMALKALAAGAVSIGLLARGARSSAARDLYVQCMESCLAICEQDRNCRVTEHDCARSCSQALW
jgi:hypothetical protein